MKNKVDYKLYLVTDRGLLGKRDICTAVEEAIKGGATLVQLREKNISTLEFYNIAVSVKKVTDKYEVPLIINDRIDIALAVDAAGIHVGQSDMPAKITRKLIGNNKIVGVSVANIEEAKEAVREGADYIGVGAIFSTTTKDDARDVDIDTLKEIKGIVHIPVVAIGGINEKNISLLKPTKIDGIAVISDILGKVDIKGSAQKLRSLI